MPDPARRAHADELYVGYLPVPRGVLRVVRVAVPAVLWVMVVAGVVAGRSQPDPGPAVWDAGAARTLVGTVTASPYPTLHADDRGDGRPGPVLLVEVGKRGGQRAAALDGRRVAISGWPLRRAGLFMLEMEPGDAAFTPDASRPPAPPPVTAAGPVTLRGEIVDAKCYLGAMKPGEGKTHKECATLCIAGGIPPMLVTRGPDGEPVGHVLLDERGGPIDPALHRLIADPVEVAGRAEEQGGQRRLRVRTEDVRPR